MQYRAVLLYHISLSSTKALASLYAAYVDNEKRLAAKCKQLNKDLVGAAARVTAALRLSEEDQTTIATLRKELEKTWRRIDAGHDKVLD